MFYTIDHDKSGVIDCDELRDYLRSNNFDDFFISRFLRAFDADRDGKITFEEFRRALHKVPHVQKTYTTWHHILHKVDKDKNGYITMDELYELLQENGDSNGISVKQLQSFVREYDRDGDGKLNYHEFLDYILDTPQDANKSASVSASKTSSECENRTKKR
ncbi:unnamed protein product [Echinostoma caproni]|uniref:EF hand n=1 Tax=Echinostoma caproni TaxID=27848 RepID=A0A183APJ2_9TREM|nr:unnamed protein product [Echinostoma caproni]